MTIKSFENGDSIVAKATHVTSLAECTRRFGKRNKSKWINGTVLSIYNKKTKTGRNSRHVRAKFDLGGGSYKIADVNIRSIQAAPEEESGAVEEQPVAVAVGEEEVVPNSAVDDGVDADAVAVPVDDATPVAVDASSTADTTLDCAQSLLGDMAITDDNGTENAVENTTEKAPNADTEAEEQSGDDVMLEDNSNPPAETTVQEESSPAIDEAPATDESLVDIVHECEWYQYDNADHIPLNGKVPKKKWGIRLHSGEVLYQNGDVQHMYSPLDYFLMSFPNAQMDLCIIETNKQLREQRKRETTATELYKLFGIIILITRFETTSRARLWSTVSQNKYIPAVKLGAMTGMPRQRFDDLWSALRWSHQPKERPQGVSHAEHRWMLINDMVEIFNHHREDDFIPGEWICADESISRWYGLGGHWINIGLPMYIAIDRKPESGCEIQNSACGKSGVMLRLKIVKHVESEDLHLVEGPDELPHGTSVLKYLVLPWAQTSRGVCADSYFASVATAQTLMGLGLRFIGVVKSATKKFPMKYLSSLELLEGRGQREGVIMKSLGVPWIMALVWVDRDRRYFISTASSLKEGKEYSRDRWRQPEQDEDHLAQPNNQDAVRQHLTVPQPEVCEIYYDTCGAIDQHNRHRQDTLQIEKKCKLKYGIGE